MVKGMAAVAVSCAMSTLVKVEIVGAPTMTRNLRLAVLLSPSVTVTEISETPCWPAVGVTITVRLESLPPNTMPLRGTKAVLVEFLDKVRLAGAVSPSLTVKAMEGVAPLAGMAELRSLYLYDSAVKDTSPLADLSSLVISGGPDGAEAKPRAKPKAKKAWWQVF